MGAETIPIRSKMPKAPEHLGEHGKNAWAFGADLWTEGVITSRDLPEWTLYCEAFDEKAKCIQIVAEQGEYSVSAHGCVMEHPAIKRRQRAEAKIDKYSKAFGLIPDSRKKKPSVQSGVATRQIR